MLADAILLEVTLPVVSSLLSTLPGARSSASRDSSATSALPAAPGRQRRVRHECASTSRAPSSSRARSRRGRRRGRRRRAGEFAAGHRHQTSKAIQRTSTGSTRSGRAARPHRDLLAAPLDQLRSEPEPHRSRSVGGEVERGRLRGESSSRLHLRPDLDRARRRAPRQRPQRPQWLLPLRGQLEVERRRGGRVQQRRRQRLP
jgi:hypothetical protein